MTRQVYNGDNPFQLTAIVQHLVNRQASFAVDFPTPGRTAWELWGTGPTAVDGRDADILREAWEAVQYRRLKLVARDRATEIYIADEHDSLVQRGAGEVETSLMGGTYYVQFGRRGPLQEVVLARDTTITEGPDHALILTPDTGDR